MSHISANNHQQLPSKLVSPHNASPAYQTKLHMSAKDQHDSSKQSPLAFSHDSELLQSAEDKIVAKFRKKMNQLKKKLDD